MTYLAPRQPDELSGLLGFLADQRIALQSALHGITDEQARLRPIPSSTLSLGGLVKHMVAVEKSWIRTDIERSPEDERIRDVEFTLLPGETVQQLLAAWAVEAAHTDEVLARVALEQLVDSGPAGPPDFNVRWVMLHLIEETARHAGHADLIREAIDGGQADELRAQWTPQFD
ncbi:DinB family protein [Nakamurella lactea]|uniref:DinB family protein n=1 Tax=Nakamurella lactea TaxID=459515 RepID=UPI0004250C58|nr:DinB family protein [Nakamurella lactea]